MLRSVLNVDRHLVRYVKGIIWTMFHSQRHVEVSS